MMRRLLKIIGVIAGILAMFFVIFRTPDTDPAEMRTKYGSAPSQFVTLPDGTEVHYRDEGPRDGLPIILLHGSNADLHTWQPWAEALRDDYRIIRFDQIGHGLTGATQSGGYTRAEFASDVGEIADLLQLPSFVLGGNSMGGGVAVEYALTHPERVKGLILVDAGGGPVRRGGSGSGNIGFTLMRIPGIQQLATQVTPRSLLKDSLSQSVTNQAVVTEEAVDRYWELLRYPGNRQATLDRFTMTRKPFEEAGIRDLPMPALIMWGTLDPIVALGNAEWFDGLLQNSTLILYDGVGHLPHEELADQSAEDLREWLVSAPLSMEDSETSPL
ncbi:alpha/beta fold hydrolase [Erythrobacter sp. HA6-11]